MAGMFCALCKKKHATVHLTKIVAEQMQKRGLCENCAKAEGVNDPLFAPEDLMPEPGALLGTKAILGSEDLMRMHEFSAAAKRHLIANSWKLIRP